MFKKIRKGISILALFSLIFNQTPSIAKKPDYNTKEYIEFVKQHLEKDFMQYDEDIDEVIIRKKGFETAYTEKINTPAGISFEVIDENYIKLTDTFDKDVQNAFLEYVIINNQIKLVEKSNNMAITYPSIQDFIDYHMNNSIFKEFDKADKRNITIGNQDVLVKGPNRNNDYELSDGRTSLIYHPNTKEYSLGRHWIRPGVRSEILDNSTLDKVLVKEDLGKRGSRILELNINFWNKDPNECYSSKVIEGNIMY